MNPNTATIQRHERLLWLAVLVLAATFAIGTVRSASDAAFVASTGNAGNSFGTGSLALSDNDAAVAMFDLTGIDPSSVHERCIEVTYTGSLDPQPVALFMADSPTGTLGPYLNLTVDIGQDGTDAFSGCTNFTPTATLFAGTLSSFRSAHGSFASGLTGWNPIGEPETRVFRFRVSVQDLTAAHGAAAGFGLTWETQS